MLSRLNKNSKVLLGLILLIHIGVIILSLLRHSYLTDDSIQYLTLAENLSEAGVFSQSFLPPFIRDVQRTPGYPALLMLLGSIPVIVIVIQHFLILASGWLLYRIISFTQNEKVARFCAILWLLTPYSFLFGSLFLSEAAFIFFFLLAIWFFMKWNDSGGWFWLGLSFLLMVIGAYLKPVGLPLIIVLGMIGVINAFIKKEGRLATILIPILAFLLLIFPWMLRNKAVSGELTFSSMGKMGMIHGRAGGAETLRKGYEFDQAHWFLMGDSLLAMEKTLPLIRRPYSEKQNQETTILPDAGMGITFGYLFSHPGAFVHLTGKSIWQMLSGLSYGWALKITGSKPLAVIMAVLQGVLLLVFFAGAIMALLRFKSFASGEWLALAMFLAVIAISAAAWADGRYRMIVDPMLVMLLAFSVEKWRKKEVNRD